MAKRASIQMRLAAKGYGWYLALKIGKAIIAVPWFFVTFALVAAIGIPVYLWEAIKALAGYPMELWIGIQKYWSARWFSGFSRSHYKSLTHYKKLVPRPPEDTTP